MPRESTRITRGLTGLAAFLAYLGMARITPWNEHLSLFLVFYSLAFLASWAAARSGLGIWPILVGAVVFRAFLVPSPPALSDDLFRYVWEGRVQRAGFDPYVLPPTAPELSALRDGDWPRINHPDATAIYPPLAQMTFRGLATWGGVSLFKAFFAFLDLGVVLMLAATLRSLGLPRSRLALYAWHPLAIVEVAGNGHLESLALLPFLLAIYGGTKRKPWAWCGLGASLAVKYAGIWVAPFLWRSRRPTWGVFAVTVLGLTLVSLPFVGAGGDLFASLRLYASKWRFNDLLFMPLPSLTGSLARAKIVATVIVLVVLVWLLRRHEPLPRAALFSAAAVLLFSPTIHPWYLLWFSVLLPLVPWTPLLLWSGSIVFAYLFLFPAFGAGPFPQSSFVPRMLQTIPVLLGLLWVVWKRKKGPVLMARAQPDPD